MQSRKGFVSIKKQIVQILQTLAYKAYGFEVHFPWPRAQLIINKQQDKIGYKIPIPHIIYNKYSEDGFMYSDPGTTPRQIAQDILIHFKSLNHLQMQSDQFGNILGYVKQQYFEQMCMQFINNNRITCRVFDQLSYHQNQSIKLLATEQQHQVNSKQLMLVLFRENANRMSLSELRQQYVLQAILNIQHSIFNRKSQIVSVSPPCAANVNPTSYQIQSLPTNHQLSQFNTNTQQLLYSSLRHEVIDKERRIQELVNINVQEMGEQESDKVQVVKFGIVVPQGYRVGCESVNACDGKGRVRLTTQQVYKLKSIFYDHPLHRPIHLPLIKHPNQYFHQLLTNHLLTLPPTVQQLILKIDELTSQHKVNQLYHLYLMLNQLIEKSKQSPKMMQQENKESKRKLRYLEVAEAIGKHLHDVFYSQ